MTEEGYILVVPENELVAMRLRAEAAELRLQEAEKALQRISEQQPNTLSMIEHNGFVFDDIGNTPGNWQHLAFTVYTELCEVDSIARAALDRIAEGGTV